MPPPGCPAPPPPAEPRRGEAGGEEDDPCWGEVFFLSDMRRSSARQMTFSEPSPEELRGGGEEVHGVDPEEGAEAPPRGERRGAVGVEGREVCCTERHHNPQPPVKRGGICDPRCVEKCLRPADNSIRRTSTTPTEPRSGAEHRVHRCGGGSRRPGGFQEDRLDIPFTLRGECQGEPLGGAERREGGTEAGHRAGHREEDPRGGPVGGAPIQEGPRGGVGWRVEVFSSAGVVGVGGAAEGGVACGEKGSEVAEEGRCGDEADRLRAPTPREERLQRVGDEAEEGGGCVGLCLRKAQRRRWGRRIPAEEVGDHAVLHDPSGVEERSLAKARQSSAEYPTSRSDARRIHRVGRGSPEKPLKSPLQGGHCDSLANPIRIHL